LKIPGIVLQIKHFLRSAKLALDKVSSAHYSETKLVLLPVKRGKRKNKVKQIEVCVHTHDGVEPKLVKMCYWRLRRTQQEPGPRVKELKSSLQSIEN